MILTSFSAGIKFRRQILTSEVDPGVTVQINPPLNYTRVYSGLYPGIIWNIPWGIVWELPDYNPGYILGAPRVYPTSPDYTPSDAGWGIVRG